MPGRRQINALSLKPQSRPFLFKRASGSSCPPALKWAPHGQPSKPLQLPLVANTQQVVFFDTLALLQKGNLDYVAGRGVVTLNRD